MAKDTPIEFTVGDREDIVETKTLVKEMDKKLDKLGQLNGSVAAQETRISSLEQSRKRGITAALAVLISIAGTLLVLGIKAIIAAGTGVTVP